MNNKFNALFGLACFVFGAGVGSAFTWRFVKKKYEDIANEEISSVKEVYSEQCKKCCVQRTDPDPFSKKSLKEDPVRNNYNNIIKNNNYSNDEPVVYEGPVVISPDDFGEIDDYECISLTYYADDVLVDELGEELDEEYISTRLGKTALSSFGEYEDDSVFVRNDALHRYYEILRDIRNYSDVIKKRIEQLDNKKPHEWSD